MLSAAFTAVGPSGGLCTRGSLARSSRGLFELVSETADCAVYGSHARLPIKSTFIEIKGWKILLKKV